MNRVARIFLVLCAINGFLTVGLGAFGAHALKGRISSELIEIFQTGVAYQGLHTVGLALVGLLLLKFPVNRWLTGSGILLVAGIALFSGSLYMLALTGYRGLGMVTPFGGISFLAGWLALVMAILKEH
jgi:uncharacterized membrane protein YgdD (TMEM256/DUF423 family)